MWKQRFCFIEKARNLTESDFGKDVYKLEYQTAGMMGKVECCRHVYFFTCPPSFNVSNIIVFFRTEELKRTTVSQTCIWSGESINRRSYATELLLLQMSSNSRISRLIQCVVSCRFSVQYVKLTWWPSSVDLSKESSVQRYTCFLAVCVKTPSNWSTLRESLSYSCRQIMKQKWQMLLQYGEVLVLVCDST
jgi:hypothetical protein